MRFDRRQLRVAGVVLLAAGAAGWALRPLADPAWEGLRARRPALRLKAMEGAVGQGVTVALLGGFRALVADLGWLRTNIGWEREDLAATQTLIRLVTTVDPRPLYFWLNGSRMIAYDMPAWRIRQAGGYDQVPVAWQRRFDEEQAQVALRYLEDARAFHPRSPAVLIEMANVHLNRRGDVATAARLYREAAELPGAPRYAARIYAELLRRQGRLREAREWLVRLYPTLPRASGGAGGPVLQARGAAVRARAWEIERAMADVVLARIRELEAELGVAAADAFRPDLTEEADR